MIEPHRKICYDFDLSCHLDRYDTMLLQATQAKWLSLSKSDIVRWVKTPVTQFSLSSMSILFSIDPSSIFYQNSFSPLRFLQYGSALVASLVLQTAIDDGYHSP